MFAYHDAFNADPSEVSDLKARYVAGQVGDVEVKRRLIVALDASPAPIWNVLTSWRRSLPSVVEDVLRIPGTKQACRLPRPSARSGQPCGLTPLSRPPAADFSALTELADEIVVCRLCPRLVAWRIAVAIDKVARFASENVLGVRVARSFGDPDALVSDLHRPPMVGTAQSRTPSRAIGRATSVCGPLRNRVCQPANVRPGRRRPTSTDAYLAAAVRCAPPRPVPSLSGRPVRRTWFANSTRRQGFASSSLVLGWDAAVRTISSSDVTLRSRPRQVRSRSRGSYRALSVIGSFHPSQRNTFTGRLRGRFLRRAAELAAT